MAGPNIKITIESEEHYWLDLMEGLTLILQRPVSMSNHRDSRIRAAVTHFKTKLTNALANPEMD